MVNKQDIERILRENKPRLAAKYHLTSIGLFGSFTRDDFHDDSDIDIIIEYDQPMGIEFIDLAIELELLLKRPVDLVTRKGIKPKYFKEIQKDLVYV